MVFGGTKWPCSGNHPVKHKENHYKARRVKRKQIPGIQNTV